MKFNKSLKLLLAVTILTSAIFSIPTSAYAEQVSKQINVSQGDIKIYVDGNLQTPKDANGKVIEPMIYNGTVYLPVRGLTGMLTSKDVSWDSTTSSVYIGAKPSAATKTVKLEDLAIVKASGSKVVSDPTTGKIGLPNEKITTFNNATIGWNENYLLYNLDDKYKSLQGKFIIPYTNNSETGASKISFYSINNNGEETLLQEYSTTIGSDTTDVSVPLTNVNRFKIENNGKSISLYDVTLTLK